MSESQSHRRTKSKAAGRRGQTEAPLSNRRRLDAQTPNKATEVERSGDPGLLGKAARRLKASRKPHRILQVPQPDMNKAAQAMKQRGVSSTVKNMSDTKRVSVRKKKH